MEKFAVKHMVGHKLERTMAWIGHWTLLSNEQSRDIKVFDTFAEAYDSLEAMRRDTEVERGLVVVRVQVEVSYTIVPSKEK